MKVKEEIFNILRHNYDLRKVISDKIKNRESTVYMWSVRKQHNKVGHLIVAGIIMKEMKLSKKDFFEPKINTDVKQ